MKPPFPKMFALRQQFPAPPPLDIAAAVRDAFGASGVLAGVRPGARIAVAVGSRGTAQLASILSAVLDQVKGAGAKPFILPAMGSHGGATAEGQRGLLEDYGITEQTMRVPIRPSMSVERIGQTADGAEVFCSAEALHADGIVLINRVKPHTDFQGTLGSGLLKMSVIGLGTHQGAAVCHRAAARSGYEPVLRAMARVVLGTAPVLCGVAIVESQAHAPVRLAVLAARDIEAAEGTLLEEARQLMPRLPFDDVDLLIVDQLGKNISGSGMDPNVTGRWVHGYSTGLGADNPARPMVRRIFVRDLSAESHGNAIGLGFADFTTTRLVNAMDRQATYVNALTSLTLHGPKIPIHFDTDRECIARALESLALSDTTQAKVLRIRDTLSLQELEASEGFVDAVSRRRDLLPLESARDMRFDAAGQLLPLDGQGAA